jgi:response regulator NasT
LAETPAQTVSFTVAARRSSRGGIRRKVHHASSEEAMKRPLRIVAADDERSMRSFYLEVLASQGHQVRVSRCWQELIDECRAWHPELIITEIQFPHFEGQGIVAAINRDWRAPMILVTGSDDSGLEDQVRYDDVMAFLCKPINSRDLTAAITLATLRFERLQGLSQEASELKQALESRKIIECAKGVVMRRLRISEAEAYAVLRGLASARNRKLVELARLVLDADRIYQSFESVSLGPAN